MAGVHLKESLYPGAPSYNLPQFLDRLRTRFDQRDWRIPLAGGIGGITVKRVAVMIMGVGFDVHA